MYASRTYFYNISAVSPSSNSKSNNASFFIFRTLWTFLLKTYEIFKSRKKQAIPQRFPIKPPSELRSYKMKFLAKTHPNLARGNKM